MVSYDWFLHACGRHGDWIQADQPGLGWGNLRCIRPDDDGPVDAADTGICQVDQRILADHRSGKRILHGHDPDDGDCAGHTGLCAGVQEMDAQNVACRVEMCGRIALLGIAVPVFIELTQLAVGILGA